MHLRTHGSLVCISPRPFLLAAHSHSTIIMTDDSTTHVPTANGNADPPVFKKCSQFLPYTSPTPCGQAHASLLTALTSRIRQMIFFPAVAFCRMEVIAPPSLDCRTARCTQLKCRNLRPVGPELVPHPFGRPKKTVKFPPAFCSVASSTTNSSLHRVQSIPPETRYASAPSVPLGMACSGPQ